MAKKKTKPANLKCKQFRPATDDNFHYQLFTVYWILLTFYRVNKAALLQLRVMHLNGLFCSSKQLKTRQCCEFSLNPLERVPDVKSIHLLRSANLKSPMDPPCMWEGTRRGGDRDEPAALSLSHRVALRSKIDRET